MTDLSPEARALLRAASAERGPSEAAATRVRRQVIQRVATAAIVVGTAATTATTASATVGVTATSAGGLLVGSVVAKSVVVGIGVLALAGSAYGVHRWTGAASPSSPKVATVVPAVVHAVVVPRVASLASGVPLPASVSSAVVPVSESPSSVASVEANAPSNVVASAASNVVASAASNVVAKLERVRTPLPTPAAPSPRVAERSGTSPDVKADEKAGALDGAPASSALDAEETAAIRRELEVVRRAQAALQGGEPAMALRVLEEFARTVSLGAHTSLAEERAGLRAIAWCQLHAPEAPGHGSDAATAVATSFTKTFPRSPLGGRVREACQRR